MEFSIDLVSGVGPVLIAPYRIAPTELVKLKNQIKELRNGLYNLVCHLEECWFVSDEELWNLKVVC